MQINQILYTKVPKETSPWKKSGFQTLGYPLEAMDRKEILEIETKIHFPGQDVFEEKRTVFYQKVRGTEFLVIMYVRSLPEEKDEFGRSGMFMAHGFLLPKAIWENLAGPLDIAPLLEQHVIRTHSGAVNCPKLDLSTGNLEPIELNDDAIANHSVPPPPQMTETGKRLFFILFKIAQGINKDLALIIRGNPNGVEELLNQLFAKLPTPLKSKLGWDSGFDGGKIFFSQLRIFGYSDMTPTTGSPIQFNLDKNSFHQDDKFQQFSNPGSWFERWIARAPGAFPGVKTVDLVYQLSQFLNNQSHEVPPLEEIPASFMASNRVELVDQWSAKVKEVLPDPWNGQVSKAMQPAWLLKALLNMTPMDSTAEGLEKTILSKGLDTSSLKAKFPSRLTGVGSNTLKCIERIWDKDKLEYKDYEKMRPENESAFFNWLARTKWAEKDWFFSLLSQVPKVFGPLSQDKEFRNDAEEWAIKQIGKPFKPLAPIIARQMINDNKLVDLVQQKLDWEKLLENFLRNEDFDYKDVEKIINLGKKLKVNRPECNVLHNFVNPGAYVDDEIANDPDLRRKYLNNLIQNHGKKEKELQDMGFDSNEVGLALATVSHGIGHKVGRFFRKLKG